MTYLQKEEIRRKLEAEIANKIDYNGKVNITFLGDFAFSMLAIDSAVFHFTHNTPWIDRDMLQDLQQARVLNWCRTADQIYPLSTKSDGNCLCHAVSTAIWGVADDQLTLRNLIYVSIDAGANKHRWQVHYESCQTNRESLHLNRNEWEREWNHVIDTASSTNRGVTAAVPFAHLEAIHIFTLASILRRPIIVLADSTARTLSGTSLQESDIGGIYLPLDWPPKDCHKHPIVLGYTMSHFCPLLPHESTERCIFTVPIVSRDGSSLPVRFLKNDEEKRAAKLLKSYLKVKEVALSTSETLSLVLSTEIKTIPLTNKSSVLSVLPNENIAQSVAGTAGLATSNFNAVACITPGCSFFGSPATGNMCSSCLIKYTQQETQQASSAEPSAPPSSMPLSGQFVDLSMMGETCKGGCGLRCSTKTYPYCHECFEKMRLTARVGQKQTTVTESSLFGAGSAAQSERQEVRDSRCRGEGCERQGQSHLGELCDRCYMGEERRKQICASPGCTGIRGSTGYCFSCEFHGQGRKADESTLMKKQVEQQTTGLTDRQEETGSRGGSSSSLIESGTRCNLEPLKPLILTGPEDKIKCASPMCNTLIYPPNKLCKRCIDILMQSQATSTQQQQQLSQLEPTVVSIKEEELPNIFSTSTTGRSNSTPVAVRQHMMKVQLPETSRPSSAPIGKKCLTPGCTRFGDPAMGDLCTLCYEATCTGMQRSLGSSSVGSETIHDFQAMMTRVEDQKRCPRQCKLADCKNYGNPSKEGFCNRCYPIYQSMKQNL